MSHKYEVIIQETLEMKVTVEAETREEAERLAEERWQSGNYVLNADHFTGVAFHGKKAPARGREGR